MALACSSFKLDHRPHRPSPLSPPATRSASFASSLHPSGSSVVSPAAKHRSRHHLQPFSQRAIKANPLLQRGRNDHARGQRLNSFLSKVREDSEQRRWQARGGSDEVVRMLFIAERKRWESRQARLADEVVGAGIEDQELPLAEEWSLDEYPILSEEEEIQYLVSGLQNPTDSPTENDRGGSGTAQSVYGSDDEELDQLLLELEEPSSSGVTGTEDAMDVSHG